MTRVVNVRSCCPGYEHDGKGFCQAVCKESCGKHGSCSEPEICRCDPGFSGEKCNVVGCPGMWKFGIRFFVKICGEQLIITKKW